MAFLEIGPDSVMAKCICQLLIDINFLTSVDKCLFNYEYTVAN